MNYKTRFFNQITFRVLLIFGTALCYSLLMDYLQLKEMLDDVCPIYSYESCNFNSFYEKGTPHSHWSGNHFIYFFMNLALMITQAFRLGSFIISNLDDYGKITYKKRV